MVEGHLHIEGKSLLTGVEKVPPSNSLDEVKSPSHQTSAILGPQSLSILSRAQVPCPFPFHTPVRYISLAPLTPQTPTLPSILHLITRTVCLK